MSLEAEHPTPTVSEMRRSRSPRRSIEAGGRSRPPPTSWCRLFTQADTSAMKFTTNGQPVCILKYSWLGDSPSSHFTSLVPYRQAPLRLTLT